MYIGIDLGGTNIAAGLVDDQHKIRARASRRTRPQREGIEIIHDMADLCRELIEDGGAAREEIVWVGVGSPGSVRTESGSVFFASNLPFHNLPLCDILVEKTGLPVYLGNDANTATLGEIYAGTFKGYSGGPQINGTSHAERIPDKKKFSRYPGKKRRLCGL